jgi:hypothetical protein
MPVAPAAPDTELPPKPVARHPKPVAPPASLAPLKWSAAALALIWLVLAFVTYFPAWQTLPVLRSVYAMLGVNPTTDLALSDVVLRPQEKEGVTQFLVSGNIVNQSPYPMLVPAVRVRMMNAQNESIWARVYNVDKLLQPGEIYPFRITNAETASGSKVAKVLVEMGNSFELLFR